jgi:RNA methyltransferase, TrmH family
MIRTITSLTNQSIKDIRALHMKKVRDETGLFLTEGLKIILDALEQGFVPSTLIYGKEAAIHEKLQLAINTTLAAEGEVLEVTQEILEKISRKDNPQMVLGVFNQMAKNLSEIDPLSHDLWVALEQIRDPGNLGTIIRTADAAGCGGVILIGDCVDAFAVETVRASMGSIFSVSIIRCCLDEFKAQRDRFTGCVVGTLLTSSHDYRSQDYKRPTLLVMGTEQSGLSPQMAALCDTHVKIPMRGRADSLNLSVATGIIIFAAAGL